MTDLNKFAVGYARVSTRGQEELGESLDSQERLLREWAERNDFGRLTLFREAKSGKSIDGRPEFQEALDLACRKKGPLVVYNLSRMARSVIDASEIFDRVESTGATLVSLTEPIDTRNAMGKFMYLFMGLMGQFQRELISETPRASIPHRKVNGRKYCRNAPVGWRVNNNKTLVPGPREVMAGRIIMSMTDDGEPVKAITKALRKAGIRGRRNARQIDPSVVWRLAEKHKAGNLVLPDEHKVYYGDIEIEAGLDNLDRIVARECKESAADAERERVSVGSEDGGDSE